MRESTSLYWLRNFNETKHAFELSLTSAKGMRVRERENKKKEACKANVLLRLILCYMRAIKKQKRDFFITQFYAQLRNVLLSILIWAFLAKEKLCKHFMFLCEFLSRSSHVCDNAWAFVPLETNPSSPTSLSVNKKRLGKGFVVMTLNCKKFIFKSFVECS